MALDDLKGIKVADGVYLYDGSEPQRFDIVARNYDVRWSTYEADGLLEPGEQPAEAGPNGLYYYVSATGPFRTLDEARDWAERAWGPVRWNRIEDVS